jgi:4-hydroxyphenylpyruvate dioxygenase
VEQAGGTILPIPSNYYEDLAARLQMPDNQLDRMRRLNILYDRLGTAEFFHFYTLPFEQRFFFEVVQRTGSYDLYGASNAPVRLAALAHHHGSGSQIIP